MKREEKPKWERRGDTKKNFWQKSLADQRELSMRAVETFALSGRRGESRCGTWVVTGPILGLARCLHVAGRYCGCS